MHPTTRWLPIARRAASVAAVLLAGCTVAEMRADNDRREQTVRGKEIELRGAQEAQAQLQAERQALLTDLNARSLTVAELKARLQSLQRLNSGSAAATPAQAQRKIDRARQLDAAAAQVRTLEQDAAASQEAKARRLEDVRRQLRTTLEMLAIS